MDINKHNNKENYRNIISSFFAHPLIITLFASGILGYIGNGIKEKYEEQQKNILYIKQITDKKYALIKDLANNYEQEMTLLYNIKFEKNTLNNNKELKGYRKLKDELISYDKFWDKYINKINTISTLAQIEAIYKNKKISEKSIDIKNIFNEFQKNDYIAKDNKKILDNYTMKLDKEIFLLTGLMGEEVKDEIEQYTEQNKAKKGLSALYEKIVRLLSSIIGDKHE